MDVGKSICVVVFGLISSSGICAQQTTVQQSAADHLRRADELANMGNLEGAIFEYSELIRLDPDSVEAHWKLCVLLNEKPGPWNHEDAVAECRVAIRLNPNSAEAHNGLGIGFFYLHDKSAVSEFRKAISLNPGFAAAHHNLGYELLWAGNVDGAIAEYRAALSISPDDASIHHSLGKALAGYNTGDLSGPAGKGDYEGAAAEFRAALRFRPSGGSLPVGEFSRSTVLILRYPDALKKLHYELGDALALKGDLDEAFAEYQAYLDSEDTEPKQDAHNALGEVLFRKGDLDRAIGEFRASIEVCRGGCTSPLFHFDLAMALEQNGRTDEALEEYRTALKLAKERSVDTRGMTCSEVKKAAQTKLTNLTSKLHKK